MMTYVTVTLNEAYADHYAEKEIWKFDQNSGGQHID